MLASSHVSQAVQKPPAAPTPSAKAPEAAGGWLWGSKPACTPPEAVSAGLKRRRRRRYCAAAARVCVPQPAPFFATRAAATACRRHRQCWCRQPRCAPHRPTARPTAAPHPPRATAPAASPCHSPRRRPRRRRASPHAVCDRAQLPPGAARQSQRTARWRWTWGTRGISNLSGRISRGPPTATPIWRMGRAACLRPVSRLAALTSACGQSLNRHSRCGGLPSTIDRPACWHAAPPSFSHPRCHRVGCKLRRGGNQGCPAAYLAPPTHPPTLPTPPTHPVSPSACSPAQWMQSSTAWQPRLA